MSRVKTEYFPDVISQKDAKKCYKYLRDNIDWDEGVRSKNGFTRLAKSVRYGDRSEEICSVKVNRIIDRLIRLAILETQVKPAAFYVYVNYYKNGQHWCPNHTHQGTVQVIISLGTTRTLTVGKKDYEMGNGDIIKFGSSVHGIKKDSSIKR